jgi:hypothetical protein
MPRWLKHVFFVLLLVIFSGCTGSCSGCSGCGMTPLPGGFPVEGRIENSSSVRITKSGFDFIAQNLGALAPSLLGGAGAVNAGVVTFDVPSSDSDIKDPIFGATIGTIHICPGGPQPTANPPECVVEADLGKANLTITTAAPTDIKVNGTLAVRLQKLPLGGSGVGAIASGAEVVLDDGGKCSPTNYANVPVTVDVSLEVDKDPNHASRKGYTKVKINEITIDQNAISSSITFCGSALTSAILNLVKPLVIGQVMGGLTGSLTDTVEQQLCTKTDPANGITCPSGTFPDSGGTCRFCTPDGSGQCPSSAECVGMALGTDGNLNLSSALASLSPGTKGGFDFLAAVGGEGARDDGSGFSWGDMNPVGGGATLGMIGGASPTPIAQCVPIANLEKPVGIPIPDELEDASKLFDDGIPNWTGSGPHLGFAVSERYLNYALGAIYNSGALCLGVGSGTLGSLLNSDTIGLLIPSFKDLARQRQAAPLALVLRPQSPPSVVVGKGTDLATDPLLKVTMNKLSIDFYVWSSDRFIRAFTATFDIVAPVNIDVTDQGLAPVLDKVEVNNPTLSNSLLREDEAASAKKLADIVAGQIGSALGGAINPIDLSSQLSSYGLSLNIPPSVQGEGSPGLTELEKGPDRFLALFAGLDLATSGAYMVNEHSDTSAEISEKRVDAAGLSLPSLSDENAPAVELKLGSNLDDGAHSVEWQWRLDGGLWHPWSYERWLTIRDPLLSIQMRHKVEVRSRVAREPRSMDVTPAVVEVVVDKTAPDVSFDKHPEKGKLGVHVSDLVSPASAVRVRYSLDGAAVGDWTRADALEPIEVGSARAIAVEAVDEEGNVATVQHSLIRGSADPAIAAGSGCNCNLAGTTGSPLRGLYGLPAALLLGLGLFLRRGARRARAVSSAVTPRRVRALCSVALMAISASWSGCSCGSDDETANKKTGPGPDECPNLDTCEALTPGLVGAYASAAVASDGTVWVAGYDDLGYGTSTDNGEQQYVWGDLVVGKWDGKKVSWESVDGLPAVDDTLDPGTSGGPPDPTFNDVYGFRGGLTEPGDDVGLWTSIGLVSDKPVVSYFDAKNRQLKFASYDGKKWTTSVIQQKAHSDIGRYAKLQVVGGKPVVAYLFVEPGADGGAKSGVRVASASKGVPGASADWSFVDVYSDPATPCRAYLCATGECRQDTGKCQATSTGCAAACGTDQKCFDDSGTKACQKIYSKTYPDAYPQAAGLYVSLSPTKSGLGMVFYDRIHGNLYASSMTGGKWSTPVLLDGQGTDSSGAATDTGDVGIGASLFIDSAGDWHTSYVNGFDETVIYMKVAGGTTPGTPEVVDDGVITGGQAVVGDDSSITVDASGKVMIAYQDATLGKARLATGTASGATHTWTKKDLAVTDFAGAFNQILSAGGKTQVMTWWRHAKPRTEGDVTFVAP